MIWEKKTKIVCTISINLSTSLSNDQNWGWTHPPVKVITILLPLIKVFQTDSHCCCVRKTTVGDVQHRVLNLKKESEDSKTNYSIEQQSLIPHCLWNSEPWGCLPHVPETQTPPQRQLHCAVAAVGPLGTWINCQVRIITPGKISCSATVFQKIFCHLLLCMKARGYLGSPTVQSSSLPSPLFNRSPADAST